MYHNTYFPAIHCFFFPLSLIFFAMETLNPEQKSAVNIVDGPVLVLAGAGSGKTRVVTERIVHLIQAGIPAYQILGLTFTNKAAGEMRERVNRLTQAKVWISTFHSLGARILRESITELGFTRDFVIYDEEDAEKLLRSCLKDLNLKEGKGDLKAIKTLISKVKNNLLDSERVDSSALVSPFQEHFSEIYARYVKRCKECNAVDFDDLLYLPVRLFQENEAVLEKYQNHWRYLLIDEYQDTNHAQYTFVKALIARISQPVCGGRSGSIHLLLARG